MLRAIAGELLFLGLSEENIRQLKLGRPIDANFTELGQKVRIIVFYGETEEQMRETLTQHGLITPHTRDTSKKPS
jgi:hypothetical protein